MGRNEDGRLDGIDYTFRAEREGKRYRKEVSHAKNVYESKKGWFRRLYERFIGGNAPQASSRKPQEATIELKKNLKGQGLVESQIERIVAEAQGKKPEPDITDDCVEAVLDTYGSRSNVPVKRDELVLWINQQLVRESGTHYNVDLKSKKRKGKYFLITSDLVRKDGDEEVHQVVLKKLR